MVTFEIFSLNILQTLSNLNINSTIWIYYRCTKKSLKNRNYTQRISLLQYHFYQEKVCLFIAYSFLLRFAVKWDTAHFWRKIVYLEERYKVCNNLQLYLCAKYRCPWAILFRFILSFPYAKVMKSNQQMRFVSTKRRFANFRCSEHCSSVRSWENFSLP